MPPRCTICGHPDREAIEGAIAGRQALRAIATRYGTSASTLIRHRDRCVAPKILQLQAHAQEHRERTVRGELEHLFVRVNKLFDACDAWLTDPNDPSRYELGPRAEELQVIWLRYADMDGLRIVVERKKEPLATILKRIEATGLEVERIESKCADPRKLVLETAAQLKGQVELLAKLTHELDERPQINIIELPQWAGIERALVEVLEPHLDLLEAFRGKLAALGE